MPKKTFPVTLNDGHHRLYFDNWAFYQFEDVEGAAITSIDTSSIGIKTLTHIIWAGLLHEFEQEPTIKEVAKLIPMRKFTEVLEAATDAITDGFGEAEEDPDEDVPVKNAKADPGTGKSGSE